MRAGGFVSVGEMTTMMSGEDTGHDRRRRILDVPVDDLTLPEATEMIRRWVAEATPGAPLHHVVTVNPEFIIAARRDPAFRQVLEKADLATADGVGVLLAARLLGRPLRGRVTGVDVVEALAAGRDGALRLFLLGAAPGIAERAAAVLIGRFPGTVVAGCWSGSPRSEDAQPIFERLRQSQANVLLVAFGHPAQDRWVAAYKTDLAACGIVVAMGIGGTLDYLAGAVPRAPRLLRRLGLEWLYRLIRQPWRWRRQLALPLFAGLVARERLRRPRGRRRIEPNA